MTAKFLLTCRPKKGSVYEVPLANDRTAVCLVTHVAEIVKRCDFHGAYYILRTDVRVDHWQRVIREQTPDWMKVTVSHCIGNGAWPLLGSDPGHPLVLGPLPNVKFYHPAMHHFREHRGKKEWILGVLRPDDLFDDWPRVATDEEARTLFEHGKAREGYIEAKLEQIIDGRWRPPTPEERVLKTETDHSSPPVPVSILHRLYIKDKTLANDLKRFFLEQDWTVGVELVYMRTTRDWQLKVYEAMPASGDLDDSRDQDLMDFATKAGVEYDGSEVGPHDLTDIEQSIA